MLHACRHYSRSKSSSSSSCSASASICISSTSQLETRRKNHGAFMCYDEICMPITFQALLSLSPLLPVRAVPHVQAAPFPPAQLPLQLAVALLALSRYIIIITS
eukprot:TRINITY_DN11268_c0_g1_i5.p3 TRINITY_DN11268_c0_g1~~TRINITY_DN11268_c0_g1_i5.p3  ORF type:complete len:104 (-),score=2.23 TRINITY_DN11268_c0_g1_i5:437-748(-)